MNAYIGGALRRRVRASGCNADPAGPHRAAVVAAVRAGRRSCAAARATDGGPPSADPTRPTASTSSTTPWPSSSPNTAGPPETKPR